MAFLDDGSPDFTPNAVLLRASCIGCHANGGDTMIDARTDAPQVYHSDPLGDLAGGNFAYLDDTKGGGLDEPQHRGHNVIDLLDADTNVEGPPGMSRGEDNLSQHTPGTALPVAAFTCAGADGCHGQRLLGDEAGNPISGLPAMVGAHHGNVNGVIDGTGVALADGIGNSYRFLWGVYGSEDPDWQATASATEHNGYYGDTASSYTSSCGNCHLDSEGGSTHTASPGEYLTTPTHTISAFCGTCHGEFHLDQTNGEYNYNSAATASGPAVTINPTDFVRHPVDYELTSSGEYTAYSTYDLDVPVARNDLSDAATRGTVNSATETDNIVMCLSCHQSHGSQYESMLRWDYDAMITNGGGADVGCFKCHSTKN